MLVRLSAVELQAKFRLLCEPLSIVSSTTFPYMMTQSGRLMPDAKAKTVPMARMHLSLKDAKRNRLRNDTGTGGSVDVLVVLVAEPDSFFL